MGYHLAVAVVTRLSPAGLLYLVVGDTLLHQRGRHVFGLGWFRDAVASTRKRVATASGNNWVVLGLAVCVPFAPTVVVCLPLAARLHQPGKGQPSCAALVKGMLTEVLDWFPRRRLVLCGGGACAAKGLLANLAERVTFVGRMRGDAAVQDRRVPAVRRGQRGRRPTQGPRLPSPKEMARRADRKRKPAGEGVWPAVTATAHGQARTFRVVTCAAVWPKVLGPRPVQLVVARDVAGKLDDTYLFTTDRRARAPWVIETFARRWSIEVAFKARKQVPDMEAPPHGCRESMGRLAPWVWLPQTLTTVWYLSEGHRTPEAKKARQEMGAWESEWSLRHMLNVLRGAVWEATIKTKSADPTELRQIIETLKNYVKIAV